MTRGIASTPKKEAARREKIATFARTRYRDALGRYAPKIIEVEVSGWTTRSREPGDREDRTAGWDYHGPHIVRVRSASKDPDYIRRVLDRRDASRRYWEVTHVSP